MSQHHKRENMQVVLCDLSSSRLAPHFPHVHRHTHTHTLVYTHAHMDASTYLGRRLPSSIQAYVMRAKLLQSCPTLCDPMDCVVCQAPLSMGFSRQEYWSGLPHPPPGDLLDPGIYPCLFCLLHWQVGSSPLASLGKPGLKHKPIKIWALCYLTDTLVTRGCYNQQSVKRHLAGYLCPSEIRGIRGPSLPPAM